MNILNKKELFDLYNLPLAELLAESQKCMRNRTDLCSLISAKTGRCGENCKYCAQSAHYKTEIETHGLVSYEKAEKAALESKQYGVERFAVVTSGKTPQDLDKITDIIGIIENLHLRSCASLGILDKTQTKLLKDSGLKRYHHNINTCRAYSPSIVTTHTYEDRIKTADLVKNEGMELCCGVILGMGENIEHRIDMAYELAEIQPDSVPVNFLIPIKGTPLENFHNRISEEHILRTLAVFKIANPNAVIRFAGGRSECFSPDNQKLALKTSVEGILLGNMLTTTGIEPGDDLKMLKESELTYV